MSELDSEYIVVYWVLIAQYFRERWSQKVECNLNMSESPLIKLWTLVWALSRIFSKHSHRIILKYRNSRASNSAIATALWAKHRRLKNWVLRTIYYRRREWNYRRHNFVQPVDPQCTVREPLTTQHIITVITL